MQSWLFDEEEVFDAAVEISVELWSVATGVIEDVIADVVGDVIMDVVDDVIGVIVETASSVVSFVPSLVATFLVEDSELVGKESLFSENITDSSSAFIKLTPRLTTLLPRGMSMGVLLETRRESTTKGWGDAECRPEVGDAEFETLRDSRKGLRDAEEGPEVGDADEDSMEVGANTAVAMVESIVSVNRRFR